MSADRAAGIVREAGGADLLERLQHLDALAGTRRVDESLEKPIASDLSTDVDVVIAGGGLSLLYAPLLAARGLRVLVADRARIGRAHREWNAQLAELSTLVRLGLLTEEDVTRVVVRTYAYGVCTWYEGGTYPVKGVLDCAFDGRALLSLVREKAENAGVTLLDGHRVVGFGEGPSSVNVALEDATGKRRVVRTKLLVDARGAASPYASADLVCPTVGGVMTGLDEGTGPRQQDPTVGEILATTETLLAGQQHLWEAFPGHPGQTTVYLFYYTWAKRFRPGDLLELYARFFERLPVYRAGNATLVTPTFGLIPGWSRLTPAPRAPGRRVLLVGDAAARHSPLTYCGFGDLVRSLDETLTRITTAAASPRGLEDTRTDAIIHGGTGLLAAMMAEPPTAPEDHGAVNRLLDTAFSTLHAMPNDAYARLLRDEMGGREFVTFLRATAKQRPEVYASVFKRLGPAAVAKWGMNLAQGFFA